MLREHSAKWCQRRLETTQRVGKNNFISGTVSHQTVSYDILCCLSLHNDTARFQCTIVVAKIIAMHA